MIGLLLPPLNDKNLPWLDVIHPIVVHFVIAMALITVVFDLIGVLTRRRNLFEVSFWNLLVATVAIFVAIIFGQIEAGLATPYGASRDILNYHSTLGWSLAAILSLLTGWRYVARQKDPTVLPRGFLIIDSVLAPPGPYGGHTPKRVCRLGRPGKTPVLPIRNQ